MVTKLQICRATQRYKFKSAYPNSKFAIVLIFVITCKYTACFSPGRVAPLRPSSAHYFRHTETEDIGGVSTEIEVVSAFCGLLNTPTSLTENGGPKKSASAEKILIALRQTMQASSLTANEATVVEASILKAGSGDLSKIAGAVDLCQLLLETMELDISVLVAASFHYCSCDSSNLSSKDGRPKLNILPVETISIVEDAAQLKGLEDNHAAIDTLNSGNSGNLRKLLLARTNNWSALAIRSAANLHRLRGIIRNCINANHEIGDAEMRAARQAMYIYAPLASQLGIHRLKNEIESAAFQILYRRQFAAFNAMMCRPKNLVPEYHIGTSQNKELESFTCLKDEMEEILAHVTDKVTRILSEDSTFTNNVNFTVTARVKESYSLWRKALKLGAKSILDVPDALALRIIVDAKKKTELEIDEVTQARNRLVCYLAHQTCSKSFKPVEGRRFKDYVARPKSNGYQSLHYTTCTMYQNEKYPLEIQIRSRDMHQVAEFGLAAHWRYKYQTDKTENKTNTQKFKLDHSTTAYLSSCSEWHWQHAQNNDNFLMRESITSSKARLIDSSENESQDDHPTPFIKALEVTRSILTRQRVYVFLAAEPSQNTRSMHRNGKLLELRTGSCVLDALRESVTALGFSTSLLDESLAVIMHNDGALRSLAEKLKKW